MRTKTLTIVALLTFWATCAEAAVAHVATVKAVDNTAGTSAAISVTPSTGEALFGVVIAQRNAGTFTITAAWNGNAMVEDKTITVNISGAVIQRVSIFSLPNVTGATANLTFTYSTTVDFTTMFAVRASGIATSSITDGTGGSAQSTTPTTTPSTGSMSSTNSDDFWLCLVGTDVGISPATVTAGAGWTIPTNGSETDGVNNLVGGVEYIANPGATSETGNFTTTSAKYAIVGMAYKAAGAACTPSLTLLGVGRCSN